MVFHDKDLTHRNRKDFQKRTHFGTQEEGLRAKGEAGKSKSHINGEPAKE